MSMSAKTKIKNLLSIWAPVEVPKSTWQEFIKY
jgi:hypothetical protein